MPTADPTASLDRLAGIAATLLRAPAAAVSLAGEGDLALCRSLGHFEAGPGSTQGLADAALAMGAGQVLVVEDVTADPRFRDHALLGAPACVRFFAGAVITTRSGRLAGTLCVVDTERRARPDEADLQALTSLAAMAAHVLEASEQVRSQKDQLAMLGLAESMSGVGHWRLDAETQAIDWSDEVFRIHGVTRETFKPNYDDAVAFYHPDDRAEVRRQVTRVIQTGSEFQFELRLVRADGEERYIQSRAACQRAADGRVLAVYGVIRDVTEERRCLRQAERSEASYRLLADHSADVISRVRIDGSSRYISPAIEHLLGWRYEDMSGQALDYVHPDDRQAVHTASVEALTHGEPRSVQHRALHKDGRVIWVESRFKALARPDGPPQEVLAAIRDVSERKALADQLEAALEQARESERRYRLLTDRAEDIIITYRYDTTVTYASPSLETVTGIKPEEMVGTSVNRLLHPEDCPGVVAKLAQFIRDHPDQDMTTQSYRAFVKSGEIRHYETRTRIVRDDEGRVVEIQDMARDVTETRRLEAELREARDRAEAAALAKSEFLANMSHELRTPLTSVVGFAGLLKDSAALTPEDRRHVERIATGSEALLSVINDILDYSKLEAEALEMDLHPFHPFDLAHGAADLMEAQRAAKGLDLAVTVDPQAPDALLGDEGRLRQVTLNFLSNAMKFTSQGSVELAVGGRPTPDGGWRLRVSVRDTGIGVPADKLAGLFERFVQADQSTTRNFGGTGLGLAISKRLIEAMGGEIGADSTMGQGSTFWFEVPLTATEAAGRTEPIEMVAPDRTARILVADDAVANRELVSAILTQLGAQSDAVADGAEAVEAAATGFYDLILMDMHMPVMDGLEATRTIRALGGEAARIPIIALTANVQADQVEKCLDAGMNDHVGKPIDVAELARAVATWLGRRHGDAAVEAA